MDYYLSKGNIAVCASSLDLSKAYAEVSFYKLFCKFSIQASSVLREVPDEMVFCSISSDKVAEFLSESFDVRNRDRQCSAWSSYLLN